VNRVHPPSAQQTVDFAHLVGQFISIRINTMPEAWQPHNNFIDIVVKIVSGFRQARSDQQKYWAPMTSTRRATEVSQKVHQMLQLYLGRV
jgi:hypothetical protein